MMIDRRLKAVFFDMDGVLYDSMKNHALSWEKAMILVGIDYKHYYSYLNEGRTSSATIQWAYNLNFKRDATFEEIELVTKAKTRFMSELPISTLMEGMQAFVQNLKRDGLKIMVVTGSNQEILINRIIADFELKRNDIIAGHDVNQGKPNAEPYLKALERCCIHPKESIVIENAPLGIQSAKAANIYTIAINTGILEDKILLDAGADLLFSNTKEMIENWTKIKSEF